MFSVWKEQFMMDDDYFCKANLKAFNLRTLRCIVKEMKTEIQRVSQHLVHTLVERDKTAKRNEERLDQVTELLTRYANTNGTTSNFKFYFKFTNYYNDSEYHKWARGWSLISQINKGIIKQWRIRVWEGVVMYNTREISWERVLHYFTRDKITNRVIEWKKEIEQSFQQLGCFSKVDYATIESIIISYSKLFPDSVFSPQYTILTAISLTMTKDEDLSLKVLVTLLDHKLPPHYYGNGFQSVKNDVMVLNELIQHFLPQLSAHMQLLRSKSKTGIQKSYSSHNPPPSFEPPLIEALTLQWLLSCFTICLSLKIIKRVFDCLLIDGNHILLYTSLAIWTIMECELLQVHTVSDFYEKASEIVTQLREGRLITPVDFIQIIYTLKQCVKSDNISIQKLRERYSKSVDQQRSHPVCPPPSQGGNFTMTPPSLLSLYPAQYLELNNETSQITAIAECPQTKKTGFVFSYAYAADVPVDLPVKYALKMSKNCTDLLKNGTVFNMGASRSDTACLFK